MDKYKLVYKGTFSIPEAEDTCVVTLTDEGEKRVLSVVTERLLGMELKNHEQKKAENSNRLVNVLSDVVREDCLYSYYILIKGVKDKGFVAALVNEVTQQHRSMRCDEAILFSLVSGTEMYTTLEVLQQFSTPFNREVMSVALPILSLPNSLLQKALEKAIQEENYEGASFIRDEIKRREECEKKS